MEIWLALLIAMVSIGFGGLLTWIIGKAQLHHLLRRLRDMLCFKEQVSINEEFRMTQLLAEKIQKANYVPDVIFAVFPGGAMVAEWLSRRFLGDFSKQVPVQLVCVITKRSAGGTKSIVANVDDKFSMIPCLPENPKILLVNDVARSGHTLEAAREFLRSHSTYKNIKIATLFRHEISSVIPDFYTALTHRVINFEWKQT